MTAYPLQTVFAVLGIGRATAYRGTPGRPGRYVKPDDPAVHAQIRAVLHARGSYGYRRVTVVVNRTFGAPYNRKHIHQVMQLTGPVVPRSRRHMASRPHQGRIICPASNKRQCRGALKIACWGGVVLRVAFVLDRHDWECLAAVVVPRALTSADNQQLLREAAHARFATSRAPVACEWLTGSGAVFTALPTVLVAEQLGLLPPTTPVASPQSNSMARPSSKRCAANISRAPS